MPAQLQATTYDSGRFRSLYKESKAATLNDLRMAAELVQFALDEKDRTWVFAGTWAISLRGGKLSRIESWSSSRPRGWKVYGESSPNMTSKDPKYSNTVPGKLTNRVIECAFPPVTRTGPEREVGSTSLRGHARQEIHQSL